MSPVVGTRRGIASPVRGTPRNDGRARRRGGCPQMPTGRPSSSAMRCRWRCARGLRASDRPCRPETSSVCLPSPWTQTSCSLMARWGAAQRSLAALSSETTPAAKGIITPRRDRLCLGSRLTIPASNSSRWIAVWVSVTPMESARICSRLLGIPLREFARLPRGAAAARIAPAPAPARSVVFNRRDGRSIGRTGMAKWAYGRLAVDACRRQLSDDLEGPSRALS